MTRLIEPSEAYHALLDWQTGFTIEVPATTTPDVAASGLARLYATFPRLGGRIDRTENGFAFDRADAEPVVETTARGARVDAALSAFVVELTRPDAVAVSGRLHHALCDVTGILSIVDHLLGLLGVAPDAESMPVATGPDWPVAAERVFGPAQPTEALRETRLFFSGVTMPPLKPARPTGIHLPPRKVQAIDRACAAASASLTSVIAVAVAARFRAGRDRVVVGAPVDCRVFVDADAPPMIPPRVIGNCSHGILVPVSYSAEGPAEVLAAAADCDVELLAQLEAEVPVAPFRDGLLYQPHNNAPAPQFVVSNARGAACRFTRLANAGTVFLLPESSIPAMPMFAVNETPATGAVDITLIADPADHTRAEAQAIADVLARTLDQISGE